MSFLKRVLSTKRSPLSDTENSNLAAFNVMHQPRNTYERDRFLNDCDLILRDLIKEMRAANADERRMLRPVLELYERRFFEVGKVHVALGN